MSSVHLLVGRSFLLLSSSLASNMCFSRESCLFRWPKYDNYLALISFNNQPWPTFSSYRISVFFLFAIHGILSILLEHFISKALIFFSSAVIKVHPSHPYMAVGNMHALTIFNFVCLSCPFQIFFHFLKLSCGHGCPPFDFI